MNKLVEYLITRSHRHPYYHLKRPNGVTYMYRWWLFGHGTERDRNDELRGKPMCNPAVGRFAQWVAQKLFVIRVHHILQSDADRDLHDHPSWSVSVVLSGGYWELVPDDIGSRYPFDGLQGWDHRMPAEADMQVGERCIPRWRGRGAVVLRRATQRHKIVLPKHKSAWSMFILGQKSNEWGFYVGFKKVPWREYNSQHSQPEGRGRLTRSADYLR